VRKTGAARVFFGVMLCAGACAVAPAIASASSISGTVIDENTILPIPGLEVCQNSVAGAIEETCVETNSVGEYTVAGLPQGSYTIYFSDEPMNRNYVDHFFGGAPPGSEVELGENEDKILHTSEMGEGGSIAGTVTGSGKPIVGLSVCAFATVELEEGPFEFGRCTRTGPGGEYTINGLHGTGLAEYEYLVEFVGGGEFNYQAQYYDGAAGEAAATLVEVGGAEITEGIDAELEPGAEISGTLTEAGSHRPLGEIAVDLLNPTSHAIEGSVKTGSLGHYVFRGLPAGGHLVAFSYERSPLDYDGFSTSFFDHVSSIDAATVLSPAPPRALTGIDGDLARELAPAGVRVTPLPATPVASRCKQGRHRRKVKGRARCVKLHKRHHHGHRQHARH
jgi:hypothetical protein